MSVNELARQQVQQVAQALKLRIRGAGRTQRQVEEQLGMGKDYLRQLLAGNMDLKLKHLFGVLAVLDVNPSEFIAGLFGYPQFNAPPPGPEFRPTLNLAQRDILPVLIRTLHKRGVLTAAEAEAMLAGLEPEPVE